MASVVRVSKQFIEYRTFVRKIGAPYLVLVWAETKVLEGLAGLWSTKEEGVASCWGAESKLIQGENLTTGGQDTGAGGSGEAEGSDGELWDGQETVVISDGSNNDNGLVVGLLGDVGDDAREGHWWPVDAGHKQAAEDDLVEGRLGAA